MNCILRWFVACLTCCICAIATAQTAYKITDLGGLSDSGTSRVFGMNNHGQIVGQARHMETAFAFLWDEADGLVVLETHPEALYETATDINDLGQVTGSFTLPGDPLPFRPPRFVERPFVWSRTDGITELPPGAEGNAFALGINNAGTVVGTTTTTSGQFRQAVIWENGVPNLIPGIARDDWTGASVINNSGRVIGGFGEPLPSAFSWDAERGLEVLPAITEDYAHPGLLDINDSDVMVGGSIESKAIVVSPEMEVSVLGHGSAKSINNHGQIVGSLNFGSETLVDFRPVMWDANGEVKDLAALSNANELGWILGRLDEINDSGQIAGTGTNPDGIERGFLLTPVSTLNGDFDNDGNHGTNDIDSLVSLIAGGSFDSAFDLNGDGNVDLADRDGWLSIAGVSLIAEPLRVGDQNLDGRVDSADLGLLLNNFGNEDVPYSGGDLNADSFVNSADLGLLLNEFGSQPVQVPETDGFGWMCALLLLNLVRNSLTARRGIQLKPDA